MVEKDEVINESNTKIKLLQKQASESPSKVALRKKNEELTLKVEILLKERDK